QCNVKCVLTNKMGVGTFRAPGRYESCFIRERLLDMMAADLDIDPTELRLKNFIASEEMPYNIGRTRFEGDTVFDSGDYASALRRTLEEADYEGLKEVQGQLVEGKYHGVGIASFVKNTGRGPDESARVVVRASDDIAVFLGITTLGQGHETTMAQICADSLGVPIDGIRVYHGTTDYMPDSHGTFGSRGTVMAGSAIHLACEELRENILNIASDRLDVNPSELEFSGGQVYGRGSPAPLLSLDNILEMAAASDPSDLGELGLEATGYFEAPGLTYAYGSHLTHVAVDPETGQIEVLKYVVVEDIGRCINPMVVHGQAVGGAVQGIGATLLEELVYDDNGQLLSGSFMDYLLPTSMEAPPIDSIILEEAPSPLNPLGVKGAGEGGIVATGAALANAVSHALFSLGVQVRQLPLTPNRVKELIDG
ncbi:MAG: xanthine dehydrogenase family protein molybdopterin-binding subunit, partial [Dehalococcoidia bacterium]